MFIGLFYCKCFPSWRRMEDTRYYPRSLQTCKQSSCCQRHWDCKGGCRRYRIHQDCPPRCFSGFWEHGIPRGFLKSNCREYTYTSVWAKSPRMVLWDWAATRKEYRRRCRYCRHSWAIYMVFIIRCEEMEWRKVYWRLPFWCKSTCCRLHS